MNPRKAFEQAIKETTKQGTYYFDVPDGNSAASFAAEVLDGSTQKAMQEFISEFIKQAQQINKLIEARITRVSGYANAPINRKLVRKYLLEWLAEDSPWGEDEMTPLLADIILNGKYIF